jgi:hypothetical protein
MLLEPFAGEYIIVDNIRNINIDDIVFTSNMIDAYKISRKCKSAKVINWYQGIIPEEVSFKDKGFIRKRIFGYLEKIIPFGTKINGMIAEVFLLLYTFKVLKYFLDFIEKRALRHCFLNIFVSNSMRLHYKEKYKFKKENVFIIPCFNTSIKEGDFSDKGKYKNLTFAYVGGLDKWQCFEDIAKLYKEVEKLDDEALFYVFTPEVEEAMKILDILEVKNYLVKYVSSDDLENELRSIKFGFLIREESPVNFVATPTKMGNYIASGLIPIFSDTIGDFKEVFKSLKFNVISENISPKDIIKEEMIRKNTAKKIIEFHKRNIEVDLIYNEFLGIFDTYYDRNGYVARLKELYKDYGII